MFRGGSLLPAIGSPVAGGTATRILYVDSSGNLAGSASLVYDDSTKRLTVGTGSGTSAGIIAGYEGTNSGYSAIWSTAVTPANNNFGIRFSSGDTQINAPSGGQVAVSINTGVKQTWVSTAGAGPSITAGTATTDVNALSITQTWNNGAVAFTAEKSNITSTASAAGSLLRDWQYGSSSKANIDINGGINLSAFYVGANATRSTYTGAFGTSALQVPTAWVLQWSDNANYTSGTARTSISQISNGVIGVGTGSAGSTAGTLAANAFLTGGAAAAATTEHKIIKKVTGIADNTATDVFTVTVPNANHACAVKVTLLSSNGSTDAFESSRVATGTVVVARTSGANAVAAVSTLEGAQIATVAAGATHTLAYGASAISGAAGATNTFTIQVTIDDSGNLGSNQVVAVAELVNAEATGITIA